MNTEELAAKPGACVRCGRTDFLRHTDGCCYPCAVEYRDEIIDEDRDHIAALTAKVEALPPTIKGPFRYPTDELIEYRAAVLAILRGEDG